MVMPKTKQNLSDEVYSLLKKEILNGKLKGGEKIPEEALAKTFGVSRTPIREAVRRLGEYGLVTIKPRCWAEVSGISAKEATDIAVLRIDLEQLAVDCITPESYSLNIKTIARYVAECQYAMSVGDRASAFEQDSLFHLAVIYASGNQALYSTYQRLDAKIQQLRIQQNLDEETLSQYMNQHGQIMQLLKTGKKQECKDLIYEHVMHMKDSLSL